jgi:NADH-quinone oxidoreductase subunit E
MDKEIDVSKLDKVIEKYQGQEGTLIPILQEAQEICGYLPAEVILHISRKTKVPAARVYGVITFYAQFYLERRGRHTVRACRGTACHVRGAKPVLKVIEQVLEIKDGETTPDYKFSLETVACLGACFLAPVMMVDKNYYGKLIPQKVESILKQYR